jgi:hypothetical protein
VLLAKAQVRKNAGRKNPVEDPRDFQAKFVLGFSLPELGP